MTLEIVPVVTSKETRAVVEPTPPRQVDIVTFCVH
jgi:hypothetical protein